MKSQYRMLFAFVVLLLIVSLACNFGASPTQLPVIEEPPATDVPTDAAPTEPPQQTEEPAVVATEPPVQSTDAQEFFTEEFDGGIDNWSLFKVLASKDTNEDGITVETNDGYLTFDISTKYLYAYLYYDAYEYDNVAVEARVENRGTNVNNISLICRHSDEGWYEFNVANSGLYDILYGSVKPDGDIGYARLADGGSTKIKSGKDINTYKIICKDRRLTLYINGNETRTLEDNQYVLRNGKIAVSASSFDQLPVKVDYDWVTISEP
jgi:hypothetical protein